MSKNRSSIPKAIREQVLKEFNHRCAIYGGDNPHIHHIDGDPTNHDPINLIPLCPNCHIRDQHDPTKAVDKGILALFRIHRDPSILTPQFYPLYIRLHFLESIAPQTEVEQLQSMIEELLDFIAELEMGSFYSKKIGTLLEKSKQARIIIIGDPESERHYAESIKRENKEFIQKVINNKDLVVSLATELLRFQKWDSAKEH